MIQDDTHQSSPDTIGALLRDKRLTRNIGLEEVSEATGISPAVLRALESEEREKLPAEVYIKAFYKKYAAYMGINPEEIEIRHQPRAPGLEKTKNRSGFRPEITLKDEKENLFIEIIRRLFLPLAFLLLGFLLYWIYKNHLAPHNPLGYYHEHSSSLFVFISNRAWHIC